MQIAQSFVSRFASIRSAFTAGMLTDSEARQQRRDLWAEVHQAYPQLPSDEKFVVELDGDKAGEIRYKHQFNSDGTRKVFEPATGYSPAVEAALTDEVSIQTDDGEIVVGAPANVLNWLVKEGRFNFDYAAERVVIRV